MKMSISGESGVLRLIMSLVSYLLKFLAQLVLVFCKNREAHRRSEAVLDSLRRAHVHRLRGGHGRVRTPVNLYSP